MTVHRYEMEMQSDRPRQPVWLMEVQENNKGRHSQRYSQDSFHENNALISFVLYQLNQLQFAPNREPKLGSLNKLQKPNSLLKER